jgi:3-hydroxyacyl-CoA dehydrogenase
MPQPNPKHAAVLGAGTIGASWAAFFLARGIEVTLWDPAPGARDMVCRYIETAWPALQKINMVQGASAGAWRFCSTPEEAVRGTDFVQENAPERMPVKRDLYARIDPVLPDHAILASSSSGLIMTELQSGFRMAPRMAIGHPFNPPHLIPLVEVVAGQQTRRETVQWCLDFYNANGKRAIEIRKEAPGHLANRLQAALYREAISAVLSGLATVEDVDTAISAGPGLRWAIFGPHMTFHLGGGEGGMPHMLNQFGPVFEEWWKTMDTPAITEEARRHIIAGVNEAARGRSIAELARERDALLIQLLEIVARR